MNTTETRPHSTRLPRFLLTVFLSSLLPVALEAQNRPANPASGEEEEPHPLEQYFDPDLVQPLTVDLGAQPALQRQAERTQVDGIAFEQVVYSGAGLRMRFRPAGDFAFLPNGPGALNYESARFPGATVHFFFIPTANGLPAIDIDSIQSYLLGVYNQNPETFEPGNNSRGFRIRGGVPAFFGETRGVHYIIRQEDSAQGAIERTGFIDQFFEYALSDEYQLLIRTTGPADDVARVRGLVQSFIARFIPEDPEG